METTFVSIHDLSADARILYSSDSVIDILGYTPDEITNRPAWDLFPEEELPYARRFHERRVLMDRAAVLVYCRIRHKDGRWVGCECCFTIVYDVMVACTSIYRRGPASEKRALEAPLIRRIFSSSPKDPRYHMLSHISAKFKLDARYLQREPRAALFLNRFTRTLTIMYATSGLKDVIGIPAEAMCGRSFYYCIAENCLPDAVKCLENAKANNSIAYLRFWFRDPRVDDPPPSDDDSDEEMTTDETSDDQSVEGDEQLGSAHGSVASKATPSTSSSREADSGRDEKQCDFRESSGDSTRDADTQTAIFGQPNETPTSASSITSSSHRHSTPPSRSQSIEPIEIEAVISCTSDGLVVCLRRARPMIPHPAQRPSRPVYEDGLFAAPWAQEPVLPPLGARPGAGFGPAFAPALGPMAAPPPQSQQRVPGGPSGQDFLNAIRDHAIFAWGLTGINGTLADVAYGKPVGDSLPQDGLPMWANDPQAQRAQRENQSRASSSERETAGGIDPGSENVRPSEQLLGVQRPDQKSENKDSQRESEHSSSGT